MPAVKGETNALTGISRTSTPAGCGLTGRRDRGRRYQRRTPDQRLRRHAPEIVCDLIATVLGLWRARLGILPQLWRFSGVHLTAGSP